MASCAIPGFPRHLRVHLCAQEFAPDTTLGSTPMAFVTAALTSASASTTDDLKMLPVSLQSTSHAAADGSGSDATDAARLAIENDIEALENALEDDHTDEEVDAIVEQLSVLDNRLRAMDLAAAQQANIDEALRHDSDEESVTTDGTDLSGGGADGSMLAKKSFRNQAKGLLTLLGFDRQTRHMPIELLSGGWRARLGLALGLVSRPDILLLDEPTNHLGARAISKVPTFWTH